MSADDIFRLLAILVPVLTAAFTTFATVLTGKSRERRNMHADAELLQHLPEGSAARESVLNLISASADQLLERRTHTIDKGGLAIALVGTIVLGYVGIWLWNLATVWGWLALIPVAGFWLVFFFGIFESAAKKDRAAEEREKEAEKARKEATKEAAKEAARQATKQASNPGVGQL
ncbi:hypothetical protein ACFWEJ_00945 [Promicromonospora sp. NPDC060204]|uniref:hypothetical protein n=1 Tax=Promicromonospora sp. NPDC060204 TaxID=3347071 RepID=UPI00365D8BCC